MREQCRGAADVSLKWLYWRRLELPLKNRLWNINLAKFGLLAAIGQSETNVYIL